MAVVNRTLDVTEQRKPFQVGLLSTDLVNGATKMICIAPFAGTLDAGQVAIWGISGAPNFSIAVTRNGAAGATFLACTGTSNPALAYGTSGVFQMVLPAAGSTLLNIGAGDILWAVQNGGTSAAAVTGHIAIVLKPIADIKTNHGV